MWRAAGAVGLAIAFAFGATTLAETSGLPQQRSTKPPAAKAQRIDQDYTKRIVDQTPDKRILTELVDHMPLPADAKVPSPLKVLGYIPGENGNITYSKDVYRYLDMLDAASPRVSCWSIGKTEEGRDTRACAVSDAATIQNLQHYKDITARLTDPRKTSEAEEKQLVADGKVIYWATGSIHSPEVGSVEMLMELAYRLAIDDSPFYQDIRRNVIFVLTPTTEVDGHDREVDNQRAQRAGKPAPSMVYWGKYVQHDNNRDGIGKGLKLSQNVLSAFLDMHPTVLHDLHESVNLLYTSTGTGPYNPIVDPMQVNEWWWLAQNEILEMTKRGVPGVWTYNYYDGWVPNYLFWIGVSHNAIGRFYETQSYGSGQVSTPPAMSREWYRPNPDPGNVKWNSRSNVNMQESALLITLHTVAGEKEKFLDTYYSKMKHQIELGKTEAPYAYVIPAKQRKRADVAALVNVVLREGAEIQQASSAFKVGNLQVEPGDYIARMDQPYRGIVEMYLGVQWYPPENPRPYDDTGWSIPLLHNIRTVRVDDKSILDQPMTIVKGPASFAGSITGAGSTIVVDNTTDNALMTWRIQNTGTKMSAAEQAFDLDGHHFAAGAFVVQNADRAALEPSIKALGLQAWATNAPPSVPMHDLDVPRIGYIHSWQSTQDEGWVRLGLDMYKIPYTYFGDNEVRKGHLRDRFDVILYPSAPVQIDGAGAPQGGTPQPYEKTDLTPNVGTPDSTPDRRGGLGRDGLRELENFVEQGGVLITEGATTQALVEYHAAPDVSVADTEGLFMPGSVIKTLLGDMTSPILYGYDQKALAVLMKNGPVMTAATGGGGGRGFGRGGGRGALPPGVGGGNLQPMATPAQLTTLEGGPAEAPPGTESATGRGGRGGATFGGRGGRGGRGGAAPAGPQPRVLLSYPQSSSDLLLSGELVGGDQLTGHAVLVDSPVGKGHIVLFANRPFWRNEPHGNYFLWFNAILNWNDLDAGGAAPTAGTAGRSRH
jgi:hypothetical protein